MKKMKKQSIIVVGLALSYLFTGSRLSGAAELLTVESGIPLEVQDAFPTAYMNREWQALGRYEQTADGKDLWLLESRLEYGFARNWEASVHVPFEFGNGVSDEGIQDVGIDALYNFNTETRFLPALSLSGGVEFPTAEDSHGVDTELSVLVTRTLGWSTLVQRAHFNLSWLRNAGARDEERDNRYKAVVGYDIRLGPDTLLIADYVWEQEMERGLTSNIAEIGLRRMLNPLTALAVGVGFGLDDESPDFRATLGLQRSF